MSKKVKKKAAKKVVKKAAKKAGRPAKARAALSHPRAVPAKQTTAATIFVYHTDEGCRVRTSPQLLGAAPGYVEWTVVNLTSGPMPKVEISWPDGSPWGGAPIKFDGGNQRMSLDGAKAGRYKYNVTCNGYTEDPEIEYPVM